MENETYLFLAFGISWIVFAGYLWSINSQAQNLTEEIKSIKDQNQPEES